jgi:hypothetical protein
MSKASFTLALLASALALPLAAHADPIDNFVITGDGQTITYSVPASQTFFLYDIFSNFGASGPATIDGVSGYEAEGQYYVNPDDFRLSLILFLYVPETDFVTEELYLLGPRFISQVVVPNQFPPPGYLPLQDTATFIPGTYSFQGLSSPYHNPFNPPVDYTLTITPQASTAATPEPSTLALLTTGALGLAAFTTRRKRTHPLFP